MKATTVTEELIKEAAKNEFINMGFAGARMQKIAKNANINSALLHYYFRSKENLFEIVFAETVNSIFETINKALQDPNKDILTKISDIVTNYLDFIAKYPKLPMFVLTELSCNPDRIKTLGNEIRTSRNFIFFAKQIENAKAQGIIKESVNPQDVFTDILSLTLFQFTVEPFLSIAFEFEENNFSQFIDRRKKVITETIINSIKNS